MKTKHLISALAMMYLSMAGCGQQVDVPNVDLSGAPATVIKRFDEVRASAIEHPKSSAAWGELGMVFDAHEFMDEALACYQHATALDPKEFRWSYLAAVVLAERDPSTAEQEFKRVAELNSQYTPLYCNLARALVKTGRDDDARREYETALRIDPRCREALLGLGELEMQIGELEESRDHLLKSADLRFDDNRVHTLLARLYHRLGKKELAEIELNLAHAHPHATAPQDAIRARVQSEATGTSSKIEQGSLLLVNHMYAEAEKVFRQVIAQREGRAGDHLQLGRALAEQGKLREAIAELKAAMAIDDQNTDVLSTYGLLLARSGKLKQATSLFDRALKIDPSSDVTQFYAAMTLQRQGESERALKAYRTVLELNPANASGHHYLANLLAQQGDLDQAMIHWYLAATYDPKQNQAVLALVDAYNKKGLYSKTDELLSGKLIRSPDNVVILTAFAAHLASCPDGKFRNGPKAIQLAEKLVTVSGINDVRSLIFLAAVLAEAGRFERALVMLEDARKANLGGGNNPEFAKLIQSRYQLYGQRKTSGL